MTHLTSSATSSGKWIAVLIASLFFLFPIALELSNVLMLCLIIVWIFTLRSPDVRAYIFQSKIIWLLGALYALVLLGTIYTPADAHWISLHLRKYARLFYAIVIICLLMGNEQAQRWAFNGFVAAMLFTLTSTWLNVWLLLPWSASQNIGWGKTHHVFGDYITQNLMMSFFCVVALNKAVQTRNTVARVLWGLVALFTIISITHLSQGRTGYVLLVVGLMTYLLVVAHGRNLILSLVGLGLLASVALGTSDMARERFTQAIAEVQRHDVDNLSSIGHRLYNYRTTAKLIAERPVLGHGTGAFHVEICRVLTHPEKCATFNWHPHNQFLFIGANHGTVGMVLYLALFVGMYLTAWRSKDVTARALLVTFTSIMLVNSMFNSPLWSSIESQFFMYMLALLVAMAEQARKNKIDAAMQGHAITEKIVKEH